MLQDQERAQSQTHIWTDAAGSFGCGGWYPGTGDRFQLRWPSQYDPGMVKLDGESIALKELLRVVTCHCDNKGVVAVINSGYSPVPQIMHIQRSLLFIRAHYQVNVWAVHVPGRKNSIADAISRKPNPSRIPPDLLSLLVERQPDWTSWAWVQSF